MAIAHVCPGCGHDLARVRARREPHYGLRLVRCPRCGRSAVRKRRPVRNLLAIALRWDAALSVLLIQVAAGGLALAGMSLLAVVWTLRAMHLIERGHPEADLRPLAVVTAAIVLAAGTWVEAGLRHHGRRRSWGWWLIVVATSSMLAMAIETLETMEHPGWSTPWLLSAGAPVLAVALSVVLVGCSTAGIPLGMLLGTIHRSIRSHRLRWRVRRRRRNGGSP